MINAVNLRMRIEDLLFDASSEALKEAISLLIPLAEDNYDDLPYLAKAYVLNKEPLKAIDCCDRMIGAQKPTAISPWIHWAHFWKAVAFVQVDRIPDAISSLRHAYSIDSDIQQYAIGRTEFAGLFNDPEFLSAIHLSPRPQLSPEVESLREKICRGQYYEAYLLAKKLHVAKHKDLSSVLYGLWYSLDVIVEDLDEHGQNNLILFGGGRVSPEEFVAELAYYRSLTQAVPWQDSALAVTLKWAGKHRVLTAG